MSRQHWTTTTDFRRFRAPSHIFRGLLPPSEQHKPSLFEVHVILKHSSEPGSAFHIDGAINWCRKAIQSLEIKTTEAGTTAPPSDYISGKLTAITRFTRWKAGILQASSFSILLLDRFSSHYANQMRALYPSRVLNHTPFPPKQTYSHSL